MAKVKKANEEAGGFKHLSDLEFEYGDILESEDGRVALVADGGRIVEMHNGVTWTSSSARWRKARNAYEIFN